MSVSLSLEEDLNRVDWIKTKCIDRRAYAQNLYAALCNNTFLKLGKEWSSSWRSSGDLVSRILGFGAYIDWYCSGIAGGEGFVEEGLITSEVYSDLLNLGWYLK